MQDDGFFNWLGEAIGDTIRTLVEFLASIFGGLYWAVEDFADGLSDSLGISGSLFSLIVLIIGLAMLYKGLRAFLRGSVIGGVCWGLVGLLVLSWLIA
ncbi:hypothetical protein R6258_14490 [Halomonas sp. HP20-15]|uniref:hypothetical protein n=1 Tax=Halomonas sp. HP20-15 TaxID=3085901 RepID=UPI002980F423|nr:hypothetical protein [Halomonas sp. HP20-15]MDW5378128.1 hypothetical protein [Halomonas sp. HP20-15]